MNKSAVLLSKILIITSSLTDSSIHPSHPTSPFPSTVPNNNFTMKAAVFAVLFQAVAVTVTYAYPISGDSVNCRSGPGTSYAVKKTYAKGSDVKVSCQTTGTDVNGNNLWDKTQDGCYVADFYVKTGTDGYVAPKCSTGGDGDGSGSGIPGPVTNDYPYKGSCGGVDPWNYYKCRTFPLLPRPLQALHPPTHPEKSTTTLPRHPNQLTISFFPTECTSFVAWRINKRLGVKFHNQYKGVNWGNANTWDDAARRTGVIVNSKPVPGCVAQTNAGTYGHVAWVTAVGDNTVTVEEYNHGGREAYGKRTVPKGDFNYIHVKV